MKTGSKEKKIQQLKLNRETLRNMNEGELQAVVGGATRLCTEFCTGGSCYC